MKLHRPALLVAVAFATVTTSPLSSAVADPGVPSPILVIDIAKVFKESDGFKYEMENVKTRVASIETQLNQERTRLLEQRKQLEQFKPASLEYKKLEEQITRGVSDAQVQMQLKRKEIVEHEARIYHDTYQKISEIVQAIAQQQRAFVVINYSSDKMNPNDRASIIKGVNGPIVYHQPQTDITGWVISELARRRQLSMVPRSGSQ